MKIYLLTFITFFTCLSLSFAQDKFYWCNVFSDSENVQKTDSTGTDISSLFDYPTQPVNIAVDAVQQKMYWVDRYTSSVKRADLDGQNEEELDNGLIFTQPSNSTIALDPNNGHLYARTGTYLARMDLDGSNFTTLFDDMSGNGLVLDIAQQKVYAWEYDFDLGMSEIFSRDLNTGAEEVIKSGLPFLSTVTLVDDYFYWASPFTGIQKSHTDSTLIHDIFFADAKHLIVDPEEETIYFSDSFQPKLMRVNTDGSDYSVLADFKIAGGNGVPIGLDAAAGQLYFGQTFKQVRIGRINLLTEEIHPIIERPLGQVTGLVTVPSEEILYLVDQGEGAIIKASLSGEIIEDVYRHSNRLIFEMTYDPLAEQLVLIEVDLTASVPMPQVRAVSTTGGAESVLPVQGIGPSNVVTDNERDRIFWIDFGATGPVIFQAKTDGTELTELDLQGQITPRSLEIDYETGHLYILFSDSGSVAKYNPETTEMTILVENQVFPQHLNLDPVAGKMYWMSSIGAFFSIMKADMTGGEAEEVFIVQGSIPFHFEIAGTVLMSNVAEVPLEVPLITVFPNPTSELLNLEATGAGFFPQQDLDVRIIAANGKEVERQYFRELPSTLDVRHLDPGHYFLQLEAKGKRISRAFQVK